ncbi:glycerol-3-phosphate dehydrogenase/oxidase [Catelliglobosispora koreensis]|uniref:glycerol-3-phosphate dehydrogenase/oxidase n=1 Tax=Catelliglobosispora koreensis TaxID=129052 RepID=UPI0003679F48|nr:glycerol-3-phosphate dehydrogenase/oxidase [Catelliglobosispora koreensis]
MRDRSESRFAAGALSPERREADLQRLREETFDVLVVGGGVTGAGAALDAASRGLKVALIEARDLAVGTSSRSSKLIHGGLRYLEQFEFPLVHEALRERGLLATLLAPHLVRPLPFLVPLPHHGWLSRAWHRFYYGAGVALYDVFAGVVGHGRGMPMHRHLTASSARKLFPSLRESAVAGAIRYYDGQVDDARFVVTLARTAASLGAAVVTGLRARGVVRDAREVTGVTVSDGESEFVIRARTVIAATGVWSDDVSTWLPDAKIGLRVRASKGVHLVVPRSAITGEVGLILRTPKSVLFVIPWGGHWIIGTTDTEWTFDRAHPAASAQDIAYLLGMVNEVLERPLTTDDIEGVYAGLRPLLSGESDSTSSLSREHAVVEPLLGLLLVAGGKFTTYRVMAEDVVDRAARRLPGTRHSGTAGLPLLGADGYNALWRDRADLARRHDLSLGAVEHLLERYGSLVTEIIAIIEADRSLAEPLPGAPEYLGAEVVYAVRAEGARHAVDILARRTRISMETTHRGVLSVRRVAELMALELGWDEAAMEAEVQAYLSRVEAERESQRMPDDLSADAARLSSGAPFPGSGSVRDRARS